MLICKSVLPKEVTLKQKKKKKSFLVSPEGTYALMWTKAGEVRYCDKSVPPLQLAQGLLMGTEWGMPAQQRPPHQRHLALWVRHQWETTTSVYPAESTNSEL